MSILNMLTEEEKNTLKNLCHDYKIYMCTESEAKKAKEETAKQVKAILDKISSEGKETIDIYNIDYKTQTKFVADTDKMRKAGIYDDFKKQQITKPLNIR